MNGRQVRKEPGILIAYPLMSTIWEHGGSFGMNWDHFWEDWEGRRKQCGPQPLTKWQPPLQSLSACASSLGCADPNILRESWAPPLSLLPGRPSPPAFRIPCLVLTVCTHCSLASIPLSNGSPTVHPQMWFVSSLLYVIQVLNSTCAFFVCPSSLINWKKDGTSGQLCLLLSLLQSAFFAPITQPS